MVKRYGLTCNKKPGAYGQPGFKRISNLLFSVFKLAPDDVQGCTGLEPFDLLFVIAVIDLDLFCSAIIMV